MKIEELGNDANSPNSSPLAQPRRRQEVQRLAQSLAAERFASGQAVRNKAADAGDRGDDITALSTEAVKELGDRKDGTQLSRTDQIVKALKESMENIAQDPARRGKGSNRSGGAGKNKDKNDKNKVIQTTTEWKPTAQEGQILPGREVIGKIRVTREVKEVPGGEDRKATGGAGGASGKGSKGGSGNSAPGALKSSTSPSSGSGNSAVVQAPGDRKPAAKPAEQGQKKQQSSAEAEGQREQEGAAASQNLKQQGLQARGLESSGKGGGGGTQEFDVRTRATGTNQRLTVRPEGVLRKSSQTVGGGSGGKGTGRAAGAGTGNGAPSQGNVHGSAGGSQGAGSGGKTQQGGQKQGKQGGSSGPLGTFRRLDNKPILKYATLHSRNTEDASREVKKKALAAGEPPEKVKEMLELLRDKFKPDNQ